MFNHQKYCIVACRAISRQRLSKHVATATNTHATIEALLETAFLLGPCKRDIRRTIEARIIQFEESRRPERTRSPEAEESPLLETVPRLYNEESLETAAEEATALEAVTRRQAVKIQHTEKTSYVL
jgi:hypothetical protein